MSVWRGSRQWRAGKRMEIFKKAGSERVLRNEWVTIRYLAVKKAVVTSS